MPNMRCNASRQCRGTSHVTQTCGPATAVGRLQQLRRASPSDVIAPGHGQQLLLRLLRQSSHSNRSSGRSRRGCPAHGCSTAISAAALGALQFLGEQLDRHHPLAHLALRLRRKYQRTLVCPVCATAQQPQNQQPSIEDRGQTDRRVSTRMNTRRTLLPPLLASAAPRRTARHASSQMLTSQQKPTYYYDH